MLNRILLEFLPNLTFNWEGALAPSGAMPWRAWENLHSKPKQSEKENFVVSQTRRDHEPTSFFIEEKPLEWCSFVVAFCFFKQLKVQWNTRQSNRIESRVKKLSSSTSFVSNGCWKVSSSSLAYHPYAAHSTFTLFNPQLLKSTSLTTIYNWREIYAS